MTEMNVIPAKCLPTLLAACTLLWAGIAQADTPLTIRGVIVASPCGIAEGRVITGAFGEVRTDQIDGTYRTVTLNYSMTCPSSRAVRMRVVGTGASNDNDVLAIDGNDGVGIALKRGGQAWPINTWFNFNSSSPPTLQAVLVRLPQEQIKIGAFRTAASLVLEYQ
ncbi:Minor fimbrial protein PrsF precursor [compost metagenome]